MTWTALQTGGRDQHSSICSHFNIWLTWRRFILRFPFSSQRFQGLDFLCDLSTMWSLELLSDSQPEAFSSWADDELPISCASGLDERSRHASKHQTFEKEALKIRAIWLSGLKGSPIFRSIELGSSALRRVLNGVGESWASRPDVGSRSNMAYEVEINFQFGNEYARELNVYVDQWRLFLTDVGHFGMGFSSATEEIVCGWVHRVRCHWFLDLELTARINWWETAIFMG